MSNYALKKSLDNYATKESLNSYAPKTALNNYATKTELSNYATKAEVTSAKAIIASAISNKGVAASSADTFNVLANKIGQIVTGATVQSGRNTFNQICLSQPGVTMTVDKTVNFNKTFGRVPKVLISLTACTISMQSDDCRAYCSTTIKSITEGGFTFSFTTKFPSNWNKNYAVNPTIEWTASLV